MKSGIVWWWTPWIAWTLLLLVLTSYPKLASPDLGFNAQDKLYHALFYLVFGVLLARALLQGRRERLSKTLWQTAMTGVVFAVFDELHQHWIPGRFAEVTDAAADVIGILLAVILFFYLNKFCFHRLQTIRINGRPLL